MIWRFSIKDRNGVITEIEEPAGWDKNTAEIKRDPNWHGLFFSNAGLALEYRGEAKKLLLDEYNTYKLEGEMWLIIEENCAQNITNITSEDGIDLITETGEDIITEDSDDVSTDGFVEFINSKFVFAQFEEFCDGCYVKVPVEASNEIMDLRNRVDQKVNLESLVAFDEITALTAYDRLPFICTLPSKGITLQDNAINEIENSTPVHGNYPGVVPTGWDYSYGGSGMISPGFTKNVAGELGSFYPETQPLFTDCHYFTPYFYAPGVLNSVPGATIYPPYISSILNCGEGTPNYELFPMQVGLTFRLSGAIQNLNCKYIEGVVAYFYKQDKDGLLTVINQQDIYNNASPSVIGNSVSFDITYSDPAFMLEQGCQYYLFLSCIYYKTKAGVDGDLDAFTLSFDTNTSFVLSGVSHTPSSAAKVFAINEAISRVAESITNDKLRAYSNYFGRQDSQPYAMLSDGCGGLEVITNGLRIRGSENQITGKTSVYSVSLKDIFDNLCPIHNIGMGIEDDTNRAGYNRLRVEPWYYFYTSDIIFTATSVANLIRKAEEKDVYSTFEFGYSKWEAEQYTGLDEFLTKRTYRTTLKQVSNGFKKISNWIASGYALEVTRRQGNKNSKDWRYDNDTFIICTRRGGEADWPIIFTAPNIINVRIQYEKDRTLINTMFAVGCLVIISGTLYNNKTFTVIGVDATDTTKLLVTVAETVIDEYFSDPLFPIHQYQITHVFSNSKILMDVELGNITSPQNIIDPDTVYNFRISPIRNAMRWLNVVLRSYAQFTNNSKIIFTDGDGNYFAKGKMENPTCRLENQAIEENQTLDRTLFENESDAKPVLQAERIQFDYPLTTAQYRQLEAQPYGLISYEGGCEAGEGWIDTINYRPAEGTATFTLIPKYN